MTMRSLTFFWGISSLSGSPSKQWPHLSVGCWRTLSLFFALTALSVGSVFAKDQGSSGSVANPSPSSAIPSAEESESALLLRLHTLEEKVSRLKEQVFRSKARLTSIRETLSKSSEKSARISVTLSNRLAERYLLVDVTVLLDGAPLGLRQPIANDRVEQPLYDGFLPPGAHRIHATVVMRQNAQLDVGQIKTESEFEFDLRHQAEQKLLLTASISGSADKKVNFSPALSWSQRVQPRPENAQAIPPLMSQSMDSEAGNR